MGFEERILIVDDEKNIRLVLTEALEARGHHVWAVGSGAQALEACSHMTFAVALVDLKLPGMTGLELLAQMQRRWPQTVIILLTGYASLDSAVEALRYGAFDYLLKPAKLSEVVASVERALSKARDEQRHLHLLDQLTNVLTELKSNNQAQQDDPTAGPEAPHQPPTLSIDPYRRLVRHGERAIRLSNTEFDLLLYLAQNADRVVSARELLRAIQGYDVSEAEARSIIRVHIQRLRRKLEEDQQQPQYVLTVRGKGYRFNG
jgi:DNA-binding response OmpR family regulator